MTTKQKRILAILGVLNALIIGGLLRVMFLHARPQPASSMQLLPCTHALLGTLPAPLQPAVSWEAAALYVSLTAHYTAPSPPEASAQLLWDAIDNVTTVIKGGCPMPAHVVLTLNVQGQMLAHHHQARISGADLTAWMTGELPTGELATQAHYRRIDQPRP